MTPEAKARIDIDKLLAQAGWHVCGMGDFNIHAAQGVAIREFPLNTGFGFADYLLYVNGKACGVIEGILEMEARGLKEMVFDASSIQPLPEDYAHDSLKIFGETLPFIRNTYAHGSPMLHASVLGTFEIVTDLINQLYAQNGY